MHLKPLVATLGSLALLLVLILPTVGATTPSVSGTVANCWSTTNCAFNFTTTAGTGWANTTPSTISFQLPGESVPTHNLSYTTSLAHTTYASPNTTYWTVGTFLGTDVSSGYVVYGTTNTNYTAVCHPVFRWCYDTYLTDNGTILVHLTRAEATSTTIACSPTTIVSGKTACTATVTNLWNSSKVPVGRLHLSGPYGSKLSIAGCTLSSTGSCKFTWTAPINGCGPYVIAATYAGTTSYYTSSGSATITVTDGC